ncbi:GntR family transcriptional regulator [Mycolicibacterium vaccae]|uniref:GntR family transcriptional regulator n=1 Tax=Mycolicibacterium vaccae TaxID=1810 RepID=UPI003CF9D6FE
MSNSTTSSGEIASSPSPLSVEHSLSSRIYHDLRQRIIVGEFPIGSRLRERELAETLGVSRVPLREALPQLEADGFIHTTLRRGAVVTQITLRDVEELFDVRLGVEVYATRRAAQQAASGVSTLALETALETAAAAVDTDDPDIISEANADLHEQIVALADNTLLTTMMRPVSARDRWIFRMTADRDAHVACWEHTELCTAIMDGKADMAAALAYSHIERGRTPTMKALSAILPAQ